MEKKTIMKQNGFTLMELLAAVVLLGIISTIGIVSVSKVIESSHSKFDQKQYDVFVQTAQTYFTDHKKRLPLTPMESKEVTLQKLIDEKYLDNLLDSSKTPFNYQKSKVVVTRLKTGKYKYEGMLYYQNGKSIGSISSKNKNDNSGITFVLKESSKYYSEKEGNAKVYYTNQTPTIQFSIQDNDGISAYQYVIYKNGKQFKKSENIEVDGRTKVVDNVELGAEFLYGKYSLKVISYDKYGNKSAASTTSNGLNDYFYVYIDRIKPTCSIIVDNTNSTKGDNGWYKEEPITLMLKENDKESGILKHGLAASKQPTLVSYKNGNQLNGTQSDTSGITWYGLVQDKAGNLCDTNIEVKVDTQKPICSIVDQNGNKINDGSYNNGWYNQETFGLIDPIILQFKDKGEYASGINRYILANDSDLSKNYQNYQENNERLYNIPEGEKMPYYGYVRDNAGNEGHCQVQISKDITPPECPSFSTSNKNIYTSGNCNDEYTDADDNTIKGKSCDSEYEGAIATFNWSGFASDISWAQRNDYYYPIRYDEVYLSPKLISYNAQVKSNNITKTKLLVYDQANNKNECTGSSNMAQEKLLSCPDIVKSDDSLPAGTWTKSTNPIKFNFNGKNVTSYAWETTSIDKKTGNIGIWYRHTYRNNPEKVSQKSLDKDGIRAGRLVVNGEEGQTKVCDTPTYYIDRTPPELRAICKFTTDYNKYGYYCSNENGTGKVHVYNGVFVRIADEYSGLGKSEYTISSSPKTKRDDESTDNKNHCINYSQTPIASDAKLNYKLCDVLENCVEGTVSLKHSGNSGPNSNYDNGKFGTTTCNNYKDGHACKVSDDDTKYICGSGTDKATFNK